MGSSTMTSETVLLRPLDNGMAVALEPLGHLRSATAGVWIKTGSAHELPHESGLAHFLEHLFFKGTKTRNVHELMEAVEAKGGHLNAFTSREYTCLYVKMLDKDIHTGIEILADLVQNSLFCDLEKERNVILEEIASIEDTPDDHVFDLLAEYHWPEHPLGRSVSGDQDSVAKLTRDHVQSFYEAWYRPKNMLFCIAGNIDTDAVFAQVQTEFGSLVTEEIPAPYAPPSFRGGIEMVHRDIGQAHICMAFPGPAIQDTKRFTSDLMSNVLGGGSTSRLFERIREEEGLAYAIYCFNSFHRNAGIMGISAAVAPSNLRKTLDLTFQELRRLRDDGLKEHELNVSREQIKGGMLMSLESTSARMTRMAKSLMHFGRIIPIDETIEKIDAVTTDGVQQLAQSTFTKENCALLVLGPKGHEPFDTIPL